MPIMRNVTLISLVAGSPAAFANPIAMSSATNATSATTYACNPAHEACATVSGSLVPATSATTYACNPAHEACATVSGSLVPATSATTYACNPAHEACATVSGSLVPATSATTYACNPAHEACATVSGSLVPAASATTYACNPAHEAESLTWTVESLTRYCTEDKSGCDYNFNLTASDSRPAELCTIIRTNIQDAPTESWSDIPCGTKSPIKISWGYSAQFGAENAFAVMAVVNDQERAKAYFGIANVNSQKVTPSNPYGSGEYGTVGPQPVLLF